MTFKLHEKIDLGKVTLKVANLYKQVDFYQNSIGLDVLDSDDQSAQLGIRENQKILLELREIKEPNQNAQRAGLFHIAFLLPTREDLGNILYSLVKKEAPVSGASDHGYSEAIYLQDPEGNGIEIYRDKPMSEWDIREDGQIAGITIEMDAQGVLAARSETPTDRFPSGTEVGHVHLSVSDIEATEKFYTSVLGLDLKYRFGEKALFLAAGKYHHHIGANIWAGVNLPKPGEKDLGLDYFTINLSDAKNFKELKEHIEANEVETFEQSSSEFKFKDPNGITIRVQEEN